MRTLALIALLIAGAAQAQSTPAKWTPSWSAAPIGWEPAIRDGIGRPFKDETVRQEVRAGIAGRALRVRLTNELNDEALRIGGASIVRLDAEGKPIAGSLMPLGFTGQRDIIIPAGAPMLSDPLTIAAKAGDRFAVSVYFVGEARPPAHAQMVDIAPGDRTGEAEWADARSVRAAGLVSAIEVEGAGRPRVLVTFGDSITEGTGATPGKAMSWPDQLQRLLDANARGLCWAVVNAGISGNRLLLSRRGPNALARFDRDVLAVPGATHVVILEGINDIGRIVDPARAHEQATAEQLIAAHRQLLARAKAAGIKVIAGTLLPYEGAGYADAAGEQRRQTVNRWLRDNASSYDALIDFDAAMREPGKPTVMRLSEQIGDHLHPNDAGYTTMAKTALPTILKQGCRR